MRRVWGFVRRDLRHLRGNVIALVVVAGIVAVPSLYAWFNVAGSWDPYGNTGNLRVAVANEDAGYTGELVPVSVNMGERVVADLRASDSIGYEVTSADDAVEGVRSGEYYAAIVIPEDFSRDMMTILSSDPSRPQVTFYQNEKENAIATIVTNKASAAVEADIDESFVRSVTEVGAGVLDELGRSLDDEEVTGLASRLDELVTGSTQALEQAASDVRGFSALLSSTRGLLESGSGTADAALAPATDAGDALRDAAAGLGDAGTAIDQAQGSVRDALAAATSGLDGVGAAIDEAFSVAGAQASRIRQGLVAAQAAADEQAAALGRLSSGLEAQAGLMRQFQQGLSEGSAAYERVGAAIEAVEGLEQRVDQAASEMSDLSSGIGQTIEDLDAGTADATAARERLDGLVAGARSTLADAGTSFETGVRGTLETLVSQVEDAATAADGLQGGLAGALASARDAAGGATGTLDGAASALDATASSLDAEAARLSELHGRLRAALDSSDVAQVRAVLSAGPQELASFVSAPVAMDRTAVYPVDNNGSAMTPFYTTLAIWIGGVVLCALVRANPSEAALEETGCTHAQAYVGRLALFVALGLAQAALICGGDLLYLGVQCAHPWLMLLACCATSLVYVNLVFSLTASFGDVGKAAAVVLMVVQVAGSGGTFPSQMLPGAFQLVYEWLPFVHSEGAMRAAMFGIYQADYWRELAVLLAYLAPALLLGLVVRRPVIRLNEWFERRLEDTRLM